ncbi:hypothetical protein P9112_004916 [Eukaryota sp. TZLM1-RC]
MNIDLKRLRNDATLVATEHKTFESRLDLQTFLHQLALQYNKEFTVAPNNNKTRYEVRCPTAECPFKIIAKTQYLGVSREQMWSCYQQHS